MFKHTYAIFFGWAGTSLYLSWQGGGVSAAIFTANILIGLIILIVLSIDWHPVKDNPWYKRFSLKLIIVSIIVCALTIFFDFIRSSI